MIEERIRTYIRQHTDAEDEPLRAARARSEEADIPAISSEGGPMLRWCARLLGANHVVEVGSGGGYSGLWLLGGMTPRGTLTTIEIDPDNLSLAQQAFGEGRYSDRVRAMLGPALTVLPKLADANYDLVFLDAVKAEYTEYLQHAKRLLRPGGMVLADNALWHGRVADARATDEDTEGIREFNEAVHDDRELHGVILPIGDGLHVALYQPEEEEPSS